MAKARPSTSDCGVLNVPNDPPPISTWRPRRWGVSRLRAAAVASMTPFAVPCGSSTVANAIVPASGPRLATWKNPPSA